MGSRAALPVRGNNKSTRMGWPVFLGWLVLSNSGFIASLAFHAHTNKNKAGKSHACAVLQRLGARVLNADHLAHELYLPGTPLHAAVRQAFGSGAIARDGTVDRRRLGAIVFQEPGQLRVLNGIMFPAVEARVREELVCLRRQNQPWVVVEAALLLEAKWDAWVRVHAPVCVCVACVSSRFCMCGP